MKNEKLFSIAIIFLIALSSILAYYLTIPGEDAVILYEYSKNLAENGVITYGRANFSIEGATDFLWMVLIALFKIIKIPEFASALALNAIGAYIVINLMNGIPEKLLAVLALFGTSYFYSSLNGFSTILFSSVYVICIYLTVRNDNRLYYLILALCLLRPDGVIWGFGLVVYRLVNKWNKPEFSSEFRSLILKLLLPGLIYFVFRCWYFDELLPLPFLVKSAGTRDLIFFNSRSLESFYPALIPLVVARIFSGKTPERELYFFLIPILFYGMMNLEQNIGNRFVAPMFFGSLVLFSIDGNIRALTVYVFVAIMATSTLTKRVINSIDASKSENIYSIANDLSKYDGKMLITEAGRLAYYSNWIAHDSWGLNTPKYAHQFISPRDVNDGDYDLIVAHCDLKKLAAGVDLRQSGGRSWENQCNALIATMKDRNYTIFLVPFINSGATLTQTIKKKMGMSISADRCKRHDIYAVSSKYEYADGVRAILMNYGAISFSSNLNSDNDFVCK